MGDGQTVFSIGKFPPNCRVEIKDDDITVTCVICESVKQGKMKDGWSPLEQWTEKHPCKIRE